MGMALVEEFVVVAIFLLPGFRLDRLDEGQQGPIFSGILEDCQTHRSRNNRKQRRGYHGGGIQTSRRMTWTTLTLCRMVGFARMTNRCYIVDHVGLLTLALASGADFNAILQLFDRFVNPPVRPCITHSERSIMLDVRLQQSSCVSFYIYW